MSASLAAELCRITAPEKLPDRLLVSGVIKDPNQQSLASQPLLAYIFEVTKPWMPSSQLFPAIITSLEEGYTNIDTKHNLDDQFENLLRGVNQKLNEISESGETDWIGSLNGIIILLGKHELHFSQTGRCPAFLLQNNRIRQITDDASASDGDIHPLKTFSNLASGKYNEGDKLLIANQELYNEISLDALRRILNTSSPYQASVSISKELKKEKNAKISSLILAFKPVTEVGSEPEIVSLEEALQSGIKKVHGKLLPVVGKAKVAFASLSAASATAAAKLSEHAKKAATEASHKAKETFKTAAPSEGIPDQNPEEPFFEQESDEPHGDEPQEEKILENPEDTEHNDIEAEQSQDTEIGTIIPASEFALEKPAPKGSKKVRHGLDLVKYIVLKKIPYYLITGLHHFILWLQVPKNKKLAALGIAFLLVGLVGWGAYAQRNPSNNSEVSSSNTTLIAEVKELTTKLETALELQQEVEASRIITTANEKILAISSPSASQQNEINEYWEKITKASDTLSKTTRLETATASYSFTDEASEFITNLPYFYGIKKDTNTVLRTGIGDLQEIQASNPLPFKDDVVVSIARSIESDTAGYILTKQSQIARISQIGSSTNIRPIAPETGEFSAGDVIATYSSNIYIMDTKSGLIWRYLNSGTVYGEGKSLFDPNKVNLKKSVSLAIDGSFYVLKQDGSIIKLSGGKVDTTFALSNLPPLVQKFIQPTQIITNEGMTSIFVLDAGSSSSERSTARVIEYGKNGNFIKQYAFPKEFNAVTGFDINPKDNKLWLMSGSKVTEFQLR